MIWKRSDSDRWKAHTHTHTHGSGYLHVTQSRLIVNGVVGLQIVLYSPFTNGHYYTFIVVVVVSSGMDEQRFIPTILEKKFHSQAYVMSTFTWTG